jgi:nucleotide-binding universal stress UspA family protein
MYKKILAAVNEHLNSEISARYAMHLAKSTRSKVFFCYVAEKVVEEESFRLAAKAIKRLSLKAKDMGVIVEGIVEKGEPLGRIHRIVSSEGIDIVFAATRREDVQKRFYADTMARRLSVRLPCSVALVRVVHPGRIHPRKILVPLKARINHISERAYFAAMMAAAYESDIYLFHTAKPVTSFFRGEIHLRPVDLENKLPMDILLFVEYLNQCEVAHEKRLVSGKTGKNIVIEAAARRFDLVIMGASERSLLSSFLKGNPVEMALRETPCDLIILKPAHEDK